MHFDCAGSQWARAVALRDTALVVAPCACWGLAIKFSRQAQGKTRFGSLKSTFHDRCRRLEQRYVDVQIFVAGAVLWARWWLFDVFCAL